MEEENLISDDPRVSFFKKGANGISEVKAVNSIVIIFAEHFFVRGLGEASRRAVYSFIAENVHIPGINFKAIYIPESQREKGDPSVPNENQLAGLVQAARSVVENPIYKFKPEYMKHLSKNALALKFSEKIDKKNEIDEHVNTKLPSILIASPSRTNSITSHSLKQDLAKVAINGLKKYLENLDGKKEGVYLALTGGTTIMRFVNKFLHELDEDIQFSENMKKIYPINLVEIAEPQALESKGLVENSKSLHLALQDMELSRGENYIRFSDFKGKSKVVKLHAIYTGIGKAKDNYGRESNSSLVKKITDGFKKEKFPNYLFEINAIPYYSDSKMNVQVRNKLDDSITPIENLDSEYKIILCSGAEKRNAVYNLLLYCILNPKLKVCTHLILDHALFNELMKMEFPRKGKDFIYFED